MATQITGEHHQAASDRMRPQISRLRSVPDRQPFVRAVFLSSMHYMGILATATTITVFLLEPSPMATKVLIVCLGFTAVTWLLAWFKRCATHCPLCKGTPLINTGAITHKKATRIFPFNHGVSATLAIIATQKFRCMYCGTGFDILKDPSHLRGSDIQPSGEGYTAYSTYTTDEKP